MVFRDGPVSIWTSGSHADNCPQSRDAVIRNCVKKMRTICGHKQGRYRHLNTDFCGHNNKPETYCAEHAAAAAGRSAACAGQRTRCRRVMRPRTELEPRSVTKVGA